MGEPIFNTRVFDFSIWLAEKKGELQHETGVRVETIHPVLTTMCPEYAHTAHRIRDWVMIKNDSFNGQAGLQLSINTTNEDQRKYMFGGEGMSLRQIAAIADKLPRPISRKYCLNFAYANGNEIDGELLATMFNPEDWMVKITPIHNNSACTENNIKTADGYHSYAPYREVEDSCNGAGFDTLVFIPSQDEEDSLITCGNAILGGSELKLPVAPSKDNILPRHLLDKE